MSDSAAAPGMSDSAASSAAAPGVTAETEKNIPKEIPKETDTESKGMANDAGSNTEDGSGNRGHSCGFHHCPLHGTYTAAPIKRRFRHGKELMTPDGAMNPFLIRKGTICGFVNGVVYAFEDGSIEISLVNADDPAEGWTYSGIHPIMEVLKAIENVEGYCSEWTFTKDPSPGVICPARLVLKGPPKDYKPQGKTAIDIPKVSGPTPAVGSTTSFGDSGITIELRPVTDITSLSTHAVFTDEAVSRMQAKERHRESKRQFAAMLKKLEGGSLGGFGALLSMSVGGMAADESDD